MKKFITVLTLFLTTLFSNGQTQFDYLGGMPVNANITGCFYIDLNTGNTGLGLNDVKLVHGNGEIYFDALYADSILTPSVLVIDSIPFWEDCFDFNYYQYQRVWIVKGSDNIGLGNHVLPFEYSGLRHYLVVNLITPDSLVIRGWAFNLDKDDFTCFDLNTLSVKDYSLNSQEYKEYNELGQVINEYYSGFVIRVYSNGETIKTYK